MRKLKKAAKAACEAANKAVADSAAHLESDELKLAAEKDEKAVLVGDEAVK